MHATHNFVRSSSSTSMTMPATSSTWSTCISKIKTQYVVWSDRMAVRTVFCFGSCLSRRNRACLVGPMLFLAIILFFAGLRGWWLGLWPFGAPKVPSVYLCPPSDYLTSGKPIPDRYITGTELQQIPRSKIKLMENGVPKILHQTWSSHLLLEEHQRPFASWEAVIMLDITQIHAAIYLSKFFKFRSLDFKMLACCNLRKACLTI